MNRVQAAFKAILYGAAVVLGVLIVLHFALPDAPPPDDQALVPAPPLSAGSNAYADFAALEKELVLTDKERAALGKALLPGSTTQAAAYPLIAKNAAALRRLALFAGRERFSDPNYEDHAKIAPDTPMPRFFPLVDAASLAALGSERALKAGRADEALAQALLITDAAGVLLRSRQPIIVALIGFKLQELGARRAQAVIDSGKLSAAGLRRAAKRLCALPSGSAAVAEGLRFEYLLGRNLIDRLPELAAQGQDGGYLYRYAKHSTLLYQPMRTRGLFADRFRDSVAQASVPCLKVDLPPFKEVRAGIPNFVGRIIYNIALPNFDRALLKRCEGDLRVSAAAVTAAARAYRLEKGREPETVEELVPAYLPAAPVDPYDGAPMRYEAKTRRVATPAKDAQGKPLDL